MKNKFTLPELPFSYNALEPIISEEIMTLHHQKHHQAYVNGANQALERLEKAREEKREVDQKAMLRDLSFNLGGHHLHNLFWGNLLPQASQPTGKLLKAIEDEFGSLERFRTEFNLAATSVEGSGWATLTYNSITQRLILMQIENHNHFIYPEQKILLVLDVWEHAYYLDYKNDRKKYVEKTWQVLNWQAIAERFEHGPP